MVTVDLGDVAGRLRRPHAAGVYALTGVAHAAPPASSGAEAPSWGAEGPPPPQRQEGWPRRILGPEPSDINSIGAAPNAPRFDPHVRRRELETLPDVWIKSRGIGGEGVTRSKNAKISPFSAPIGTLSP